MVAWYSASEEDVEQQVRVKNAWADAPVENVELLGMLLNVARDQVIEYGPEPAPIPEGEPVPDPPDNYVLAQLMQVRNLWNAGRTTGEGEVGADGFVFRPFPLDKTIKAVIRPISGRITGVL